MNHYTHPSLCYVLPSVSRSTDTHFYQKQEMLSLLGRDRQVFLLDASRGVVYVLWGILSARIRGCKQFYVHYSFKGALAAIGVTGILGGRVWYWNCGMPWQYPRSSFHERLFRWILRHAILVTGTEYLREEYARRYGLSREWIRVVPNWINTERFMVPKKEARDTLGISTSAKVVLFVHHLSRRKGAHRIVHLLEQFRHDPEVIFLVVGSGPEELRIQHDAEEHGLSAKVRFEGAIPNKDIPVYFGAADVYIMPSEEEGFPNTLLEAMAAGVPFVASRVGGVPEIIPQEFMHALVPHTDMHAFYTKMREMLALSSSIKEDMARKEKAWVRKYDIHAVLPHILALFS